MGNYNRNNKPGGRKYGGGDFRRRDSGRGQMHKAVCDECGKDCEVPFKPSGNKPIYCSNCFEKKNEGRSKRPSRRGPGRSDFGKRDNTNIKLLEQVNILNTKVDKMLKVLESGTVKETATKKTVVKKVLKKAASKDKKNETKKEDKKKK